MIGFWEWLGYVLGYRPPAAAPGPSVPTTPVDKGSGKTSAPPLGVLGKPIGPSIASLPNVVKIADLPYFDAMRKITAVIDVCSDENDIMNRPKLPPHVNDDLVPFLSLDIVKNEIAPGIDTTNVDWQGNLRFQIVNYISYKLRDRSAAIYTAQWYIWGAIMWARLALLFPPSKLGPQLRKFDSMIRHYGYGPLFSVAAGRPDLAESDLRHRLFLFKNYPGIFEGSWDDPKVSPVAWCLEYVINDPKDWKPSGNARFPLTASGKSQIVKIAKGAYGITVDPQMSDGEASGMAFLLIVYMIIDQRLGGGLSEITGWTAEDFFGEGRQLSFDFSNYGNLARGMMEVFGDKVHAAVGGKAGDALGGILDLVGEIIYWFAEFYGITGG